MKNKLLYVILGLLIGVILSTSYFIYKSKTNTFSSAFYNFQFSYPSSMLLNSSARMDQNIQGVLSWNEAAPDNPFQSRINFTYFNNIPVDQQVTGWNKWADDLKLNHLEKIKIANMDAYRADYDKNSFNLEIRTRVVFGDSKKSIVFEFYPVNETSNTKDKDFEKIISSFKFQ